MAVVAQALAKEWPGYKVEQKLIWLMNEYETGLHRYLAALTGDADVALDCAQDTFIRAHTALKAGKQVNKQWLYKVGRNRVMDEFRHRRRMEARIARLEPPVSPQPRDERLVVEQVMEQLAPRDREVIVLSLVAGYQAEEVAAIVGIAACAVRQRLYRARSRFRDLYEANR
jgi:RNA polymerase sigma-70 factor (ECF subfamily)